MDEIKGRLLNVSLLADSEAGRAYYGRAGSGLPELTPEVIAAGFPPQPSLNMTFFGGKTIADLVFVNHYLGGEDAWDAADIANIDAALAKAMSDSALQSVIAQYYQPTPISSRMLPSVVLPDLAPATVFKDQVEALAERIFTNGGLGDADPGSTVVNIMLPRGVVLTDGFSPGFQPPPGAEAEHERRVGVVLKLDDDEDADSKHGLGGYHGSTHVGGTTVYYAVGVYSERGNGIPAFSQSWKSVVATFYHELNEARTDPDVEDANRTGDLSKVGWYANVDHGGEIGDIPINEAGAHLSLVFKEIGLADGSGTVPVQLMWSNKDFGPSSNIA
jgi:hypothetical protein